MNIKYGEKIEINRVNELLKNAGYHDPDERLKEMASIRIYDDKAISQKMDELIRKQNTIIKMLAKLGYMLEGKK